MTLLKQRAISTDYVKARVSGRRDGVIVDPTAGAVQFAFVTVGVDPVEADWLDGDWETAGVKHYNARILVGPEGGSVDPAAGTWDVWLRFVNSPETPIRFVGKLVRT